MLKEIENEKKELNSTVPLAVKVSPDIEDKEINNISDVLLNNNIGLLLFQILQTQVGIV